MATDSLRVTAVIHSTPEAIFDAFLDGPTHSAMTGAGATGLPKVGAKFTAWDGYISGRQLEFARPTRIVQAWRSSEFPADAPDSRVEILFEPSARGTRVTIVHSEIPKGQGSKYRGGWKDFYFTPMKAWALASR